MSLSHIEKYLNKVYDFRRNPVYSRTEIKLKKDNNFRLMTERDLATMLRQLNKEGRKTSMLGLKSILSSEFVKDVDPFVDYFNTVAKNKPWDGSTDFIAQLASFVTITPNEKGNHNEVWIRFFKKWLVATVAGTINADSVNHQVLILTASQGIGKTTFLNNLLPKQLKGYLFSGTIDPRNKDTLVHLAENMFINLDELENLNTTEMGNIKSLITQSEIKLRRAYGVFSENLRRRASFMGSINDPEFLTDVTGSRRFLVFSCDDIDYEGAAKFDVDLAYSQAYHLYLHHKKLGFEYHFGKDDIPEIEEMNKQFQRIPLEQFYLLKHFAPAKQEDKGNDIKFFATNEIMNEIEYIENQGKIFHYRASSEKKISTILRKHKFIKTSHHSHYGYWVKQLTLNQRIRRQVNAAENVEKTYNTKAFDFESKIWGSLNDLKSSDEVNVIKLTYDLMTLQNNLNHDYHIFNFIYLMMKFRRTNGLSHQEFLWALGELRKALEFSNDDKIREDYISIIPENVEIERMRNIYNAESLAYLIENENLSN